MPRAAGTAGALAPSIEETGRELFYVVFCKPATEGKALSATAYSATTSTATYAATIIKPASEPA